MIIYENNFVVEEGCIKRKKLKKEKFPDVKYARPTTVPCLF